MVGIGIGKKENHNRINQQENLSLARSLAHHFELNDKKMDGWKDGLFHQCHQTLQL